jgi:hypothetical protein
MLGGMAMAAIEAGSQSMGLAVSLMVLGVAVGAGGGRIAWSWLAAQSKNRVERLAADLSKEAREIAKRGDVVTADRLDAD